MKTNSSPALPFQESSVVQRARVLMSQLFGIPLEKLTEQSSLVEDLDIDSIDMIDLLSELNDEFGCELSLFDFENCNSLGELLTRLNEKTVTHSV